MEGNKLTLLNLPAEVLDLIFYHVLTSPAFNDRKSTQSVSLVFERKNDVHVQPRVRYSPTSDAMNYREQYWGRELMTRPFRVNKHFYQELETILYSQYIFCFDISLLVGMQGAFLQGGNVIDKFFDTLSRRAHHLLRSVTLRGSLGGPLFVTDITDVHTALFKRAPNLSTLYFQPSTYINPSFNDAWIIGAAHADDETMESFSDRFLRDLLPFRHLQLEVTALAMRPVEYELKLIEVPMYAALKQRIAEGEWPDPPTAADLNPVEHLWEFVNENELPHYIDAAGGDQDLRVVIRHAYDNILTATCHQLVTMWQKVCRPDHRRSRSY